MNAQKKLPGLHKISPCWERHVLRLQLIGRVEKDEKGQEDK